jgi:hypothetical protein
MASGAAVFTTSYGSPDREAILPGLSAAAQKANASSSPVFAAQLLRMLMFAEARLTWQALDDKHLFGDTSLAPLEHPWPGCGEGELLARMEQDAGLAGNCYIWSAPGEGRLVRLRPDWTTIIAELVDVPGGGQYRRVLGYYVEPPKSLMDESKGQFYRAEEVCHWAPIPDPTADFRGICGTPARGHVYDDGLTQYKIIPEMALAKSADQVRVQAAARDDRQPAGADDGPVRRRR